mgnify:CR=1 FL=1
MQVITLREFNANQKKYFELAENEVVYVAWKDARLIAIRATSNEDDLSEAELQSIQKGLDDIKNGRTHRMHEGAYDAMMKGFQQSFGDKMVPRPTGKVKEVKFGTTIKLNGVSYTFYRGPKNDFPAANILIGKKFLLMHWAPARQHMNVLQLSNREAVAQALTGLKEAKAVGVAYVLGGHGGVATKDALNFRIAYLEKMQQLLNENKTAGSFANALKAAYPGLAGEDAVNDLAQAFYK